FEHAPPAGMQRRLGLIKPGALNITHRAWLVVLVGWLPLVLLTISQSLFLRTDETTSFIWEVGAHARYLIAAPLLILAEAASAPRLGAIVHHFIETGLVKQSERFDAALASTRRLLASNAAEVAVIALAYLITAAAALTQPLDLLPAWHQTDGYVPIYSPA